MKVVFLDDSLNPVARALELPNNKLVKYHSLENALLALPCNGGKDYATNLSLWFSNPTKWKDPYERYILDKSEYRDMVLAQSFTSNRASEAQWTAYSKDELSVQFTLDWSSLVSDLKKSDEPCTAYIGFVQYMTIKEIKAKIVEYSKLEGPESLVKQIFLKRLPYSYEEEVRIVLVYDKALSSDHSEGKALESCSLDTLKKITICPQAREETTILLKKALSVRSQGVKVDKSRLYDEIESKSKKRK